MIKRVCDVPIPLVVQWDIAFPKIKAPTLIVHGDEDETVPYSQSIKTSKLIPNCKLHTVKGANHHYDGEGLKEEALRVMTKFIVDIS